MPVNEKLAHDVWARYQFLRDNGHLDFVFKANKCEDFFLGAQWSKSDLALLKAQRRPALQINKIISTMSNVLGEQIFNRTDIAFKPRNENATLDVASALTKVFMQISDNNQLPWVRSDVFFDGVVSGRGFYDVRLNFTDSLQGEVHVEQVNPKNVLIDADADAYDPDTWSDVVITKWISPDQIEILYSKADADLLRMDRGQFSPYSYDSIDRNRDRFGVPRSVMPGIGPESDRTSARNIRVVERQWKKLDKVSHFVDVTTGDMRQVPDSMDEVAVAAHLEKNPNLTITKKLIHRIRWTVVAGSVVLHDDWSPYKHFTIVPFFPHFIRGRTVGLVENLIDSQELLNKSSSQELHIVNTTANSGWKIKKGSLTNMTTGELENRGAVTGLVLELSDVNDAEKIVPNQVPSGLDRISYKAEEHIKTISAITDYQIGNPREDVSAKAVQTNKASGQSNLAKVMDNMNRTDHLLARNILDIIQEYYTEQRLVRITTDKLTNSMEEITVNELTPEGEIKNNLTLGEYAVVITTQPERDTFEETQFDQAVRLRTEAAVAIPDTYIIGASRLKDKAKIIEAMEGNKDSPEAKAEAALAARQREAEVSALEAEVENKVADAKLKHAKASKESVLAEKEANTPPEDNGAEAKLAEVQLDHKLAMQKLEAEFALKKEEMDREFALKEELARKEAAVNNTVKVEDARTNRIAAIAAAKNKPAQPGNGTKPASGKSKQTEK